MSRAILVIGATGQQGGAVINALLERDADFEILAVTRMQHSSPALNLERRSPKIKIVEGNLDSPLEIFQHAREVTDTPIWGVFCVTLSFGNGATPKSEERQGKALIDAAVANKVAFFVLTSVDRGGELSIENPTDVPHFISKHNIEYHLYEATNPMIHDHVMRWCVLRPTCFYSNITPHFWGRLWNTWWDMMLKGKPLQLVAPSDVGIFAAMAFCEPEKWAKRRISLAGDELTFDQARRMCRKVTGEDLQTTWKWFSGLMLVMAKELGTQFRWLHDKGFGADIVEVRKEHPGMKDFVGWLETESPWVEKMK